MLPSIGDWLSASWADYRRRWVAVMSVLAIGGVATAAAVLLPLIPAGFAAYLGAAPQRLIWGTVFIYGLLVGLYLSTWAQAAAIRAAAFDEGAGASLRMGWRQTPAFAWVLSLAALAVGGGIFLFIVPGLIAGVLLFFAPFYQLSGEDAGMGAVELSFARVKPFFGAVLVRLLLAILIAWIPSWIPYAGWLIGPLWAPFGLVAFARLADDLKTLTPAPERPSLALPVAALSALFVVAGLSTSWMAARGVSALYESYASGKLTLQPPDAETAQSLLAVLQGQGTEDDARRSTAYVLSLSSAAATAAASPP